MQLEIEQWQILVDWNKRYESQEAYTDSHPGHGGVNPRWDEIEQLLKPKRNAIPEDPIIARATFEDNGQDNRYEMTGPSYGVVWHKIND